MLTKTKKRRGDQKGEADRGSARRKRGGEQPDDNDLTAAARETLPGERCGEVDTTDAWQAAGELPRDSDMRAASRKNNGHAKPHLSSGNVVRGQAAGEGDIRNDCEEWIADTCRQLSELQRIRVAVLKSRQAIDNRLRATVATVMGYHAGLDPEARKAAHAKAQELIDAIGDDCNCADDSRRVASRVSGIVKNTGIARAGFQTFLSALELEMTKLAKSLPVAEWVKSVRGFGLLNLAIIVGECGDLSGYANPAKVWRRMGCAPFNGKMGSTWKRKGGLSAEQWTEYGYCQRRRAIAFCLADCLIKSNDGDYRKRYDDVKAAKLVLEDEAWPKLRCHLHASLLTAKRAMRDLWRAWHKQSTEPA